MINNCQFFLFYMRDFTLYFAKFSDQKQPLTVLILALLLYLYYNLRLTVYFLTEIHGYNHRRNL